MIARSHVLEPETTCRMDNGNALIFPEIRLDFKDRPDEGGDSRRKGMVRKILRNRHSRGRRFRPAKRAPSGRLPAQNNPWAAPAPSLQKKAARPKERAAF